MQQAPRFEARRAVEKMEPIPAGTSVTLIKRAVFRADTTVPVGQTMNGTLVKDITIGDPIEVRGGGITSNVQRLYQRDGRLYAQTRTSEYEIVVHTDTKNESDAQFGLNMENNLGRVELPMDAADAILGDEVVDIEFAEHMRVYINKPALRGVLMEVHNGEVFRAVGGRLIVLAKVGNIHLPFYISSKGTSGKRKGNWYPFFGYNDGWIVKGHLSGTSGDMNYHPEVSHVQNILNENFIIPMDVLSPKGKIGTGKLSGRYEPSKILFDLGRHLKYQNVAWTEYGKNDDDDEAFVHRITGYLPSHVHNGNNTPDQWIRSVISSLK